MAGAYDHLLGELQPGDSGWLPLDSAGTPSGPATKQPPPGPNALACSVMANSTEAIQQEGEDALLTTAGAPITAHMTSNVDRRAPGALPPAPPAISSLNPASAQIGDPDFTLVITGIGLDATTIINFAGQDEPTTWNGSNNVSTIVKPSLWATPASVPVYVYNGATQSNHTSFEFTAPVGRKGR